MQNRRNRVAGISLLKEVLSDERNRAQVHKNLSTIAQTKEMGEALVWFAIFENYSQFLQ